MSWACDDVQDRALRPAADRRAFELHLAALEWSLVDPIIINGPDDIKAGNWRDRGLTPFAHQIENLITFCRRLPVALIADDVGLGKTITAGLILSELVARRRVRRALVICPKVLAPQWVAELDEKFAIAARDATGNALDAEINGPVPVVVTTYDSARSRLENIESGTFDLCILDEAHKLRNLYGAPRPPAMAVQVRKALERRPFNFVLMLTATPIQNKIWDLYSLIELLKVAEGKPNPLGDPDTFSRQFLAPRTDGRKLLPDKAARFQQLVRECLSRKRRTEVRLRFPERNVQLVAVPLGMAEQDMIRVVAAHVAALPPFLQVSVLQAMMSSPRALVTQARNMGGKGSFPAAAVAELQELAARVPVPAKLDRLLRLIDTLRERRPDDWRAVVFTVRVETQEMIGEALRARGISVGFIRGDDARANQRAIDGYRQKPPKVNVVVSTDAGAEGVNLQAGNVLINYDLPWNPMVVEQRIGRVQRLGSEFANVVIANLVGDGTIEDRVVGRLTEKLQGIAQAIGDIEGILEAADIDDEGDKSFEARIRDMVVKALQGYDVEQARAAIAQNIEEARQLFEDRRHELDETLGRSQIDKPAKPMPNVQRQPPRVDFRQFVLAARSYDGSELRPIDADTYEVVGRIPERISFTEKLPAAPGPAVFGGVPVRCHLPGQPAFERLVQHWVDHHAHFVFDRTGDARTAERIARAWCGRFAGCEFVAAVYAPETTDFQGRLHVKVKAGTGVDSYEKIIRGRQPAPKGHPDIEMPPGSPNVIEAVVSQLLPHYTTPVKAAVKKDKDVNEFCNYYVDRLNEALAEAGPDPHKRAKIAGDFQPYVQAEVVGLEGVRYDTGTVTVTYRIEGAVYCSALTVVPAANHVVREPETRRCVATGADWPADAVAGCEATGRDLLRHRLVATANGKLTDPSQLVTCAVTGQTVARTEAAASSVSGRVARADLFIRCAITGKRLLPDEAATSAVSGRKARPDLLESSELSGRSGLPDEMVRCHETGRRLLQDEAAWSAKASAWYGRDRLRPSALSGVTVPPPDLVACEQTGSLVLENELETCTATGLRVRRDLVVRSAASGRPILCESAVLTDDNRFALPDEVAECAWTGRVRLLDEVAACRLSGVRFAADLMNDDGEFHLLRKLLDGTAVSVQAPATIGQLPDWRPVTAETLQMIWSAAATAVVVGEERQWLGLRVRYRGAVLRSEGDGWRQLGLSVVGHRSAGRWLGRP